MKIFIIICIVLIILFYISNILFKKYEYFDKNDDDNTVCGTKNDICRINENGISSCCKNYSCILKHGNYQYKICVPNSEKNSNNNSSLQQYVCNQNPILPNLPKNNIFTKNYWKNIFLFGDEYSNIKDPNIKWKMEIADICKNNKINIG